MTWATVSASIEFYSTTSTWGNAGAPVAPFASSTEEGNVRTYLESLYNYSTKAAVLMEKAVAGGLTLKIGAAPTGSAGIAYGAGPGAGYISINLAELDKIYVINSTGNLVKADIRLSIIHELHHAIEGSLDPKTFSETSFSGPAVDFQNDVALEMGLPQQVQVSYKGQVSSSDDKYADINTGESLTGGKIIENALLGRNDTNDIVDLTGRSAEVDYVHGFDGNDSLKTGGGNDFLYGGGDNDTLDGGSGNDSLLGGAGDDSLLGDDGADTLLGGDGADTLLGGQGGDTLGGGNGADTLDGGDGADTLGGGDGENILFGGEGADTLFGGNGADTLDGGQGDDEIHGDYSDNIDGGDGVDTLVFEGTGPVVVSIGLSSPVSGSIATNNIENFTGSIGNDTFYLNGNGAATISGFSSMPTDGIDYYGMDRASFANSSTSVSINIAEGGKIYANSHVINNVEVVVGSEFADTISASGWGGGELDENELYQPHGVQYIVGGAGNDVIDLTGVSGLGAEVVWGKNDGFDTIVWGANGPGIDRFTFLGVSSSEIRLTYVVTGPTVTWYEDLDPSSWMKDTPVDWYLEVTSGTTKFKISEGFYSETHYAPGEYTYNAPGYIWLPEEGTNMELGNFIS